MSSRTRRIVALVLLAVPAVIVGAYAGWVLWHPMDALLIWIAVVAILLVAGILAIIPRRATRTAALGIAVVGVGVLAGHLFGPHRPPLLGAEGHVEIAIDTPNNGTGTHDATCQFDDAGTELQVSGDPNLRLDVFGPTPGLPAGIDGRAFVGLGIRVGDRWRDGPLARADNVDLLVIVSPIEGDKSEVRLTASDASDLELTWTKAGGTLRFADLVNVSETEASLAEPLDMRGTITWTCSA